ncbi:hypothetical protein PY650_26915 [Rhizobium calliandrae]|uniref:Uncharacterized protein n=1 Tax=Rhizobium calliandrae TaxID=1312182 RepID=A0ABT7KKN2_9HYPH|nr:hypothetical protein [Rhizobium calliandrae]MDL2409201.1 hypothetical protein [Rhizobium calliandrae]
MSNRDIDASKNRVDTHIANAQGSEAGDAPSQGPAAQQFAQRPEANPEAQKIYEELDRIFGSTGFQAFDRGRKFLEYVVGETLAGRQESLDAYSIARAAFGRDASFDAESDPIVRIVAARTRFALQHYYLAAGHDDRVQIVIPRNGYTPQFHQNHLVGPSHEGENPRSALPSQVPQSPEDKPLTYGDLLLPIGVPLGLVVIIILGLVRPLETYFLLTDKSPGSPVSNSNEKRLRVIVEPFANATAGSNATSMARIFADGIIGQLTKIKGIVVATPDAASAVPAFDGPQIVIQGTFGTESGRGRLHVRLVNPVDGTVAWAGQYESDTRAASIVDTEDKIVRQVATMLAKRSASWRADAVTR